jgi:hypothetical protein
MLDYSRGRTSALPLRSVVRTAMGHAFELYSHSTHYFNVRQSSALGQCEFRCCKVSLISHLAYLGRDCDDLDALAGAKVVQVQGIGLAILRTQHKQQSKLNPLSLVILTGTDADP